MFSTNHFQLIFIEFNETESDYIEGIEEINDL